MQLFLTYSFAENLNMSLPIVPKNVTVYPSQIVFIRHAEKNVPYDTINIDATGQARARELPNYIQQMVAHGNLKKEPDLLVAMKMDSPTGSNRPVESINPLSNALQLPLQFSYTQDQLPQLVQSINKPENAGKTVVVCFEHHHLVPIAQYFGLPVQGWTINGQLYYCLDFDKRK